MKRWRKGFLVIFIGLILLFGSSLLEAQQSFSTLTGKVVGIRARLWLDVESEQDKAVVNFRIGRRTVYQPHRYPNVGERVKVEYLINRGVSVAYTVTILESRSQK